VYRDVAAIDVNMGCPKKFSVSGGMGSALLSDQDRACRVVKALADRMNPLGRPVSAKIRLLSGDGGDDGGDDASATIEFVEALIDAGANAVAIHGRRVGDDPATVPADWATLRRVVSALSAKYAPRRVPILVNGDFYTRDDFDEFLRETGARGVILARPALLNCSIFRKPETISESTDDGDRPRYGPDSPLLLNKTLVVQDYLRLCIKYNAHYKNCKYVVCEMMTHRRTPSDRVPELPMNWQGPPTPTPTIADVCACHSVEDICRVWGVDYDKELQQQQQPTAEELSARSDSANSSANSGSVPSTDAAPAGEHRYSDSYFLDGPNKGSVIINNSKHDDDNNTNGININIVNGRTYQHGGNACGNSGYGNNGDAKLGEHAASRQAEPVAKKPRVESAEVTK